MTLREPITLIIVVGALVGWGINHIANKVTETPMIQVCEKIDETMTVCKMVPEASLGLMTQQLRS